MKDLETLSREETRESIEPVFSPSPQETETANQTEVASRFSSYDSEIGRERYRLSPLSEW